MNASTPSVTLDPQELTADETAIIAAMREAASFGGRPEFRVFYVHDVPLSVIRQDERVKSTWMVDSPDGRSKWLAGRVDMGGKTIYLMSTPRSVDSEDAS